MDWHTAQQALTRMLCWLITHPVSTITYILGVLVSVFLTWYLALKKDIRMARLHICIKPGHDRGVPYSRYEKINGDIVVRTTLTINSREVPHTIKISPGWYVRCRWVDAYSADQTLDGPRTPTLTEHFQDIHIHFRYRAQLSTERLCFYVRVTNKLGRTRRIRVKASLWSSTSPAA